jgi:Xaa-Pro aminopeptidase
MTRLDRLRERLGERLLVTNLVNVRYLTGFDASNAALLVDPSEPTLLFTDFRYIESARQVEGVEAQLAPRQLIADLAERLEGRIAFEADVLPYTFVETLRGGGLELVPARGEVEALRAVKDEDEIDATRRAARAAERAFEALTAETWVGRSERELAWRLQTLMHAHGVDRPSFDIVIAAGANGSKPHAEPGDAIVGEHTLVVADFGAQLDGYCSDCTRTFAVGDPGSRAREVYELVLRAQAVGLEAVRAGVSGRDADGAARGVIEAAGHGERFGHGLGHGVGLEIHEAPRLSRTSDATLAAGEVVTVEPGVYLPGELGVRIEDLVLVTDDGCERLNTLPKTLTTIG